MDFSHIHLAVLCNYYSDRGKKNFFRFSMKRIFDAYERMYRLLPFVKNFSFDVTRVRTYDIYGNWDLETYRHKLEKTQFSPRIRKFA